MTEAPTGTLNGPPSLSADGRYAAWLSSGDTPPHLVVFDLHERREHDRKVVRTARCRAFTWSRLPGVGLAVADAEGNENWSLYRIDVDRDEWTLLADAEDAQMRIAGLSDQRPGEVLVSANGRDPRCHDYSVVSLRTCRPRPVLENAGYAAVYFDHSFTPRLVETVRDDGARELWHGDPRAGRLFLRVAHEEALCVRFVEFSADARTVYFVLPDGGDGTRLVALPYVAGEAAGRAETVFAVRGGDIERVFFSAVTGRPDLVQTEDTTKHCVTLDPALEAPIAVLRAETGTEPVVMERAVGGRYWLAAAHRPDRPTRYYVYEPQEARARWLTDAVPGTAPEDLECRPERVPVRDGARAVTYVTSRPGEHAPAPAVLLVHGGPWRRARWEYEERRAWLAAQGITVLEPNFRGSTGFGADWVNAADREWGGAMQADLEDTLDWAVERGLADPDRIALMGGSYGGYAVLQLAATSRRRFRCVVATSPLTDLVRFLEEPPAYWRTAEHMLRRRIGDPAVPAQRARLAAVSPVHRAGGVDCPVLLVHGAKDSRVPAEMTNRMFLALASAGQDATLALFPDEGHEIVGSANRRALRTVLGNHLSRHLRDGPGDDPLPAGTTARLLDTPRAAGRKATELPGGERGAALQAR
jgi:acetyl esterase/lipase